VLGSAGVAAFMSWRISSQMPPAPAEASGGDGAVEQLPSWLLEPFSAAMSQTMLLPAFFSLFGVVAAVFLLGFGDHPGAAALRDDPVDADDQAGYAVDYGGDETFTDDDDYVEYTLVRDDAVAWPATRRDAEPVTEPLTSVAADPQRDAGPEPERESWRTILDALLADVPAVPPKPSAEPIGFAHNGFHVDEGQVQDVDRATPIAEPRSSVAEAYTADIPGDHSAASRSRDEHGEHRPFWFQSSGRHARDDAGNESRPGRHSMPWRD
jgi:hypothetical protein